MAFGPADVGDDRRNLVLDDESAKGRGDRGEDEGVSKLEIIRKEDKNVKII